MTKPLKKKLLLETVSKWLDPRDTVLVVDDSVENRNLVQHYLKNSPEYEVVLAKNGQEALNVFNSRSISVILMDMEMSVMDGYTAATAIRDLEHGNEVPIIALTAHQGRSEVDRCLDAGCTAYLSKPVRKDKIIEALREYARPFVVK